MAFRFLGALSGIFLRRPLPGSWHLWQIVHLFRCSSRRRLYGVMADFGWGTSGTLPFR